MADNKQKSGDLRAVSAPIPSDDASSRALSEALGGSFVFVRALMVLLVAAFIFSCVFTVKPNEVAVVLRFGAPVGEGTSQIRQQGLHWAFPPPISEVVKIRIGESKTVSARTAWYAISVEDEAMGLKPMANPSLTPGVDGHVLTSDGNILHVRATLRYRITDPLAYIFKFKNATNVLESVLNNSLHWASVQFTADEALYKERPAFRDAMRGRVLGLVEEMGLGIAVDTLDVEVTAPLYVKDYFDLVISAEQDRSKQINEARGEFDRITREAEGEAQRIVSGGMIQSNALVQTAFADAAAFKEQLPFYQENKELFRHRLLVQTVQRVFVNAQDKFFMPEGTDELRLNLSREPLIPERAPQ